MKYRLLAAMLALATPALVQAGPFTDEMSKCLVRNTSDADRATLMKWIFVSMSMHPDVKAISNVSSANADQVAKDAGKLLSDLLTDRCKAEAQSAMQNEGQAAIQASFSVLGQVAMRGLMTDPAVGAYMGSIDKYVDQKKMQELSAPNKAK